MSAVRWEQLNGSVCKLIQITTTKNNFLLFFNYRLHKDKKWGKQAYTVTEKMPLNNRPVYCDPSSKYTAEAKESKLFQQSMWIGQNSETDNISHRLQLTPYILILHIRYLLTLLMSAPVQVEQISKCRFGSGEATGNPVDKNPLH